MRETHEMLSGAHAPTRQGKHYATAITTPQVPDPPHHRCVPHSERRPSKWKAAYWQVVETVRERSSDLWCIQAPREEKKG